MQASATMAGSLETQIRLAAQLAASAEVAAALSTDVRLAAQLNGAASVAAQLELILLRVVKLTKVCGSVPTVMHLTGE